MIYFYQKQFIIFYLIQKLILSGKKRKTGNLVLNFLILFKRKNKDYLYNLEKIIIKLMVFFTFKMKKINTSIYQVPQPIIYKKSLFKAISWLVKAIKNKSKNKISTYKKLYLECDNILKQQGKAYQLKYNFSKKALINRILIYLTYKK
ncbi:ribosomal protein S7 (apicoplast) [Toxoplasma gondii ME49]|uniref:Ribosomal protein S7 n=3 Tax=Toxoplasma gondii TaxID=5811 RepID=S8G827_TOXGM|nr:ribosomal protein S7 [Toxoplasma gondii ME49]KAF4646392.1 ribosomal protein S7 [Toxoplasma gondii]KYF38393.1 ribosomal protein S7 [Toxoplasma gondii ARI]